MIQKMVGVIIVCFAMNAMAGLPKHNPVQGGVAVISLKNISTDIKPKVKFQNQKVLVTKDKHANWVAIVGIPLSHKPGQASLQVLRPAKVVDIKFEVIPKEYPEQRLTIKDQNKVTPSAEYLARIKREREQLNIVLANWRPKKVDSLTFKPPVEGRKSSAFGLKRFYNDQPRSPHSGLDIAAPTGTPIRAALPGIVTFIDSLFFTGNTIVVDHGQGFQTIYCHLDKVSVKQGDSVSSDTIIGTVGQTGRATGPHLHLGVNLNQQRVDPEILLN